jgi:CheY-like chemotaxis protein
MDRATILIIDDEPNIRETMQLALEAAGYATGLAADGSAGLDAFGDGEKWDLVLLDQRMPGMDGLEVLRRLRQRNTDAEVIMVTAFATVELAVEAMKAGALDFLRKPFTPDVLRQTVAAGLRRRRASHAVAEAPKPKPAPPVSLPLVRFRSLDGYEFWPAPDAAGGGEAAPAGVERTFVVKSPQGEIEHCAVAFTRRAQETARAEAGRDLSPTDRIWDAVSWTVLMNFMWQRPGMPPRKVEADDLTLDQREIVRSLVKSEPPARG